MITTQGWGRWLRRWQARRAWRRGRRGPDDPAAVDAAFWSLVEREWGESAPDDHRASPTDVPHLAMPLWPFPSAALCALGFVWPYPYPRWPTR